MDTAGCKNKSSKKAEKMQIIPLAAALGFSAALLYAAALSPKAPCPVNGRDVVKQMLRKRLEYPNYTIIKKGVANDAPVKC